MHKTEKTAKESRMNFMYSHLCDTTLGLAAGDGVAAAVAAGVFVVKRIFQVSPSRTFIDAQ